MLGTTIVTVVDGEFGTVALSTNWPPEVVIVNGSQVLKLPVRIPDGTVLYESLWVSALPSNLKR